MVISLFQLTAQDKMIVDKPFNGNTYYGSCSEHINSISGLPSVIQYNIKGYLQRILGTMSDSVEFSHGQVVDLKKYFALDSATYEYGWIVPHYDVNFILRDNSIGIKSYYLQLSLDEFGQILQSNWPTNHYSDKSTFKSRSEIEKYALKEANYYGIRTDDYQVDLSYNQKLDILCWVFKFPLSVEPNRKEYYVYEIDWNSIEIIDEYNIMSITTY